MKKKAAAPKSNASTRTEDFGALTVTMAGSPPACEVAIDATIGLPLPVKLGVGRATSPKLALASAIQKAENKLVGLVQSVAESRASLIELAMNEGLIPSPEQTKPEAQAEESAPDAVGESTEEPVE